MALTDIKVRTTKPSDKPFKLTDGQGMHLLINPNGSKYWRLQYRFGGKQKVLALGVYPMVSLGEARRKRDEAKKLVSDGIDPSEKKKADKIEQSEALTFEAVARDWHTACKRKWSDSHSERVLKSLEDNLFSSIGQRKIAELKTKDLLVPVKTVAASGRLEVAARLQQRTTAIMRYAVQNGLIDYNPAQEMSGAIAVAKRTHRPALPFDRFSELLERIESFKGRKLTKLAVKLTLLIFIRSSELRFARWSEIDFENAMWTIPGEREPLPGVKHSHRGSKMKTPHLVPLSRQALELLKTIREISGECDLVFIGDHDFRKPMSENTVNKALRSMGYDTTVEVCGHGFRAMACSALIESGKWSRDAVERQMSHQERNSVRAAYIHKAEHLDERKLMLQWWADYLDLLRIRQVSPFDFRGK
ncbi:tyrosine-type recombinase/integrase [Salmonella enterica]|uniref:Integrase n=1 Tax=Salmonella enterica subsp. diarizonae serovar 48:i:z TaxID=1192842 RepID=A0A735REA1_SALDZ|nr:integrase arm-type DNA-binding domain-containing protein [Salmonella enterica]EAA4451476.1 integrase [Salmonella enterica subsp. diarizonae]EBP3541261.1 tyrosine-type recombinase/integrase [Salmonella enterica subsp. enterica]ECO1512369.1 tyrosine-type recombinase/integrase [Salmonella enterica subsp. arizonae]EDW6118371.1 tyrosine-type recombinase/integrase [Salmonella enterica subsp. salamae]AXC74282.1 integrase [Salmonella enterica subsp. diarizonae serovar 48:i:z]